MKHYNGPTGWISTTLKPPKPGTLGWKITNALFRMHVRVFQLTGGRIGGTLDGAPLLILHHTGAKSGIRRQSPTMQIQDGENYVIVASAAGGTKNPAWYHNLAAHPDDVEIDVRGGRRQVRARHATPGEVAELWPRLTESYPPFKTYVERTDRKIPVMILEPR